MGDVARVWAAHTVVNFERSSAIDVALPVRPRDARNEDKYLKITADFAVN